MWAIDPGFVYFVTLFERRASAANLVNHEQTTAYLKTVNLADRLR